MKLLWEMASTNVCVYTRGEFRGVVPERNRFLSFHDRGKTIVEMFSDIT
jgi:hypothetical protein